MRDNDPVKRIRRAFLLYEKRMYELQHIVTRRREVFGIAVHDDPLAIRYQQRMMGAEILRAYILGETPNWYHAPWLSLDEKKKRIEMGKRWAE